MDIKFAPFRVRTQKLCLFYGRHSNQDVIWTEDVDLVDGDSKIDGKQKGITQIILKHDLNQQQDLDLGQKLNTTNSETELCKGYGTDGFR